MTLNTVFDDAAYGAKAVLPVDLFAFGVRAAVIGNGDLVNTDTKSGNLGGDLGFKAEAVLFDFDALDNLATEGFVAGLHVRKVQVGKHVGEQREEAVADGVPEIKDPMGLGTNEAGAKDDIGAVFQNRFQQNGVFCGVVFKVGILNDNDGSGGMGDAGAEGSAFALVERVLVCADRRKSCGGFCYGL